MISLFHICSANQKKRTMENIIERDASPAYRSARHSSPVAKNEQGSRSYRWVKHLAVFSFLLAWAAATFFFTRVVLTEVLAAGIIIAALYFLKELYYLRQ